MCGYFSGLSSPSVTEIDHHLAALAEVEERRADQVADVLDEQQRCRAPGAGRRAPGRPSSASRWQPAPVLTCTARAPAARIRSASNDRLLVALDHGHGTVARSRDGPLQQGGLAGARGAHQVDRGDAALREPHPVASQATPCSTVAERQQAESSMIPAADTSPCAVATLEHPADEVELNLRIEAYRARGWDGRRPETKPAVRRGRCFSCGNALQSVTSYGRCRLCVLALHLLWLRYRPSHSPDQYQNPNRNQPVPSGPVRTSPRTRSRPRPIPRFYATRIRAGYPMDRFLIRNSQCL